MPANPRSNKPLPIPGADFFKLRTTARALGWDLRWASHTALRDRHGGRFTVVHDSGSLEPMFASDDLALIADWLRDYGGHGQMHAA